VDETFLSRVKKVSVGLIRFGRYFPKGGYDVHDGIHDTSQAGPPALWRGVQSPDGAVGLRRREIGDVTYPNSQSAINTYFGHSSDHRLQTIHYKDSAMATLSKFDYTYDAPGNIQTWRLQGGASAVMWNYTYDNAEQLMTAVKKSTRTRPVTFNFVQTIDLRLSIFDFRLSDY
jgi:hypothetical protein